MANSINSMGTVCKKNSIHAKLFITHLLTLNCMKLALKQHSGGFPTSLCVSMSNTNAIMTIERCSAVVDGGTRIFHAMLQI